MKFPKISVRWNRRRRVRDCAVARRRLRVQRLEDRRVLATMLVTTLTDSVVADDGLVSLREAIDEVNAIDEDAWISFDPALFSGGSSGTIALTMGSLVVSADHRVEIIGPGSEQLSVDGLSAGRVIDFSGAGTFAVSGLEITQGVGFGANAHGGGLRFDSPGDLIVDDVVFLDNRTQSPGSFGAGLAILGGGAATITGSEFIANRTIGDGSHGGGIYAAAQLDLSGTYFSVNQTLGAQSDGGGIYAIDPDSTRTHRFNGVTFFANQTAGDGGSVFLGSSANLNNVTTSGGQANSSGRGGNLFLADPNDAGAVYRIGSTTIIGGNAESGGGVFIGMDPESITIVNTIIAENSSGGSGAGPDLDWPATELAIPTLNASLIGDASGTSLTPILNGPLGNWIGSGALPIDPMVGSLLDNGGPVPTHRPLTGSVVIDAGDNSLAILDGEPLQHDGRGTPYARIAGSSVPPVIDLGAFEEQPLVTPAFDWAKPENILVGTALDDTQLNASVNAAGTIVYSPDAGTVLGQGIRTLTAFFIPDDPATVASATATVQIDVVNPADYGDAPSTYGTRRADGGPFHLPSDLMLGESVTYESDAQPDGSPLAGADSDDNGVVFQTTLVSSPTTSTQATLSVEASDAAMLDAWIDFDGDGTFESQERLFGGTRQVVAGKNRLTLTVPAAAVPGVTQARFRLSSTGVLTPGGPAVDGEVEDYEVTILDGALATDQIVDVPGNLIALVREADDLVVRRRSEVIYRVPFASIDRFSVFADAFSGVLELDSSAGSVVPAGGLRYDGRGLIDTLRIVGPLDTLDLTTGSLWNLTSIEAIDLSDAASTQILIDAAGAAAIDVERNGLIFTGDVTDRLVIADPENWSASTPVGLGDEVFAAIETDAASIPVGTFVQTNINAGGGWHNLVDASDIDNSGEVTPFDALTIINELRRGRHFDSATRVLNPVSETDPFPNTYYDQNNDGRITPFDALSVINDLRRRRSSASTGESSGDGLGASSLWIPIDEIKKRDS